VVHDERFHLAVTMSHEARSNKATGAVHRDPSDPLGSLQGASPGQVVGASIRPDMLVMHVMLQDISMSVVAARL
jgi:hypothetical protein